MTTPEKLSSAPAATVAPTPSDTLLKTYRLNIQTKWEKFDKAVPAFGKSMPAYTQAKAQYEQSMRLLNGVTNDADLKKNTEILSQIDATIVGLNEHLIALSESEKKEAYNLTLADMRNTLADFKGEITGKKELADTTKIPKPSVGANDSPSLESAVPEITAAVGGVGAAVVGSGLMNEAGWKKTLTEGFAKFKDWIASFFDEDSMFGSLLGGMKDKIMGVFTAIGLKLGIKPKEGDKQEGNTILTHFEKSNGEKGAKKVFEKLFKAKKVTDSSLQEYFTHENILSRSRAELVKLFESGKQDKKQLAGNLGFDEKNSEKVYKALELILSSDTSQEMKSVGVKNADNIPLGKLFSSVAKYADFLEKVKEKGKDLDVTHFMFNGSYDIKSGVGEFIGEKKELLEGIKERFHGFTPRVLHNIHTAYSTKRLSESNNYDATIGSFTDDEKEFVLKALPEYGKQLPNMLKKFAFGSPEAQKSIDEYLKKPGLNYADCIDFFVLSGGNSDMEKMNSFEKAQVITRIFLMLRKNSGEHGYAYISALTGSIISGGPSMQIPDDVKELLKALGGILQDSMFWIIKEAKDAAKGMFQSNPFFTTAAGGALVGALGLAIKLVPVARVASTFMWLLGLLGIGTTAYVGYEITKDGKKIIDKKTGKEVADTEEIARQQQEMPKK